MQSRRMLGAALLTALAVLGSACASIVGVSDIDYTSSDGKDGGGASEAGQPAKDGSAPAADAQCSAPSVACGGACVSPAAFASDRDNCGACGHSCLGGQCADSECEAVSVAQANFPNGIAVDSTSVYWTNAGAASGAGAVMKLSLNGSSLVTLAKAQAAPYGIAVDANSIYWTSFCCTSCGGPSPNGGCGVMQAGLDGSNPVTLASAQNLPAGIALDDTHVYWASYGGDVNFATKGGDGTFTTVTKGSQPSAIAVCGADLYWTDLTIGNVYKVSPPTETSSAASTNVSTADDPYAVACSGSTVYWADAMNSTAGRSLFEDGPQGSMAIPVALASQDPVNLDGNNAFPNVVLASDGTSVFYADTAAGTVNQLRKSGATTVLASGQSAPFSIALFPPGQTATAVYWVNHAATGVGGAIMRVAVQ